MNISSSVSWGACATRQGIELQRNDLTHGALADGPPRCVNELQPDNNAFTAHLTLFFLKHSLFPLQLSVAERAFQKTRCERISGLSVPSMARWQERPRDATH